MKVVADTSVLVLLDRLGNVPEDWEWRMSSLSLAELQCGVQRAVGVKGARRRAHLALIQAALGTGIPFDDACAARYGYLCALTESSGRRPRGRAVDLMIAAIAQQAGAGLATTNVEDFTHLAGELPILEFSVDGVFIRRVTG